jgi:hypothetical protein
MLEIIIGALKFLVSKPFRDTVQQLREWKDAAPEWQKAILPFEAKIRRRDREHAQALRVAIIMKMNDGKFSIGDRQVFGEAFNELVDNAFTHGCTDDADVVSIRAVVFGIGVSLEVMNGDARKIIPDLDSIPAPDSNAEVRGLRSILPHADLLERIDGGRGIKFVRYTHSTGYFGTVEGITILNVGGYAGDIGLKIRRSLSGRSGDVILIFGAESHGSARRGAARSVQAEPFVGRFAIVVEATHSPPQAVAAMDKLVGVFATPEQALAALKREDVSPVPYTPPPAPTRKRPKKAAADNTGRSLD